MQQRPKSEVVLAIFKIAATTSLEIRLQQWFWKSLIQPPYCKGCSKKVAISLTQGMCMIDACSMPQVQKGWNRQTHKEFKRKKSALKTTRFTVISNGGTIQHLLSSFSRSGHTCSRQMERFGSSADVLSALFCSFCRFGWLLRKPHIYLLTYLGISQSGRRGEVMRSWSSRYINTRPKGRKRRLLFQLLVMQNVDRAI